jgi:hypothetical protein
MGLGTGVVGESGTMKWLSWLLGLGLLAAVIIAALHLPEHEAFVKEAARAEPVWSSSPSCCNSLLTQLRAKSGDAWRTRRARSCRCRAPSSSAWRKYSPIKCCRPPGDAAHGTVEADPEKGGRKVDECAWFLEIDWGQRGTRALPARCDRAHPGDAYRGAHGGRGP